MRGSRIGETHFCRGFGRNLTAMISVLAQERLLGAAAGSIVTAIVVFDQRRSIYSSISGTKPESVAQYQRTEPLFGRKSRSELAHLWNKAVDETLRHPDGRFSFSKSTCL